VNGTVLMADDDANARIIAETLLEGRGLRVRSAIDGPDARDIISRERPAVVILDLALPGMNGLELIRWLQGRCEVLPFLTQPRIVAVTDRAEPAIERFALRLGADAFLRKPVEPHQFITTVERLIAVSHTRAVANAS